MRPPLLDRYPNCSPSAAADAALACGDAEYLHARMAQAEADRDAASLSLAWMAPGHTPAPKEALARIRALCGHWPDLYDTLLAVLATHPQVARDRLAQALKQFRADLEPYTLQDVTGLMIAAWNGGRQGFDAVLRTRKANERKAAAGGFPWGGS